MNLRWRGSSRWRRKKTFESSFARKVPGTGALRGVSRYQAGPCPDEAFLQNLSSKSGNVLAFSDRKVEAPCGKLPDLHAKAAWFA